MKSLILLALVFIAVLNTAVSATRNNTLKSDPVQVNKWNNFVT